MSTCTQFYQILSAFVAKNCDQLPKWSQARLAHFIFGIVAAQSVVFCRIARRQVSVLPHSIRVASEERRLRRVASDPHLDWNRAYRKAVRAVLCKAARAKRLLVLVDETAQAEHARLLVAALYYRGRAIPLAWHLRPAHQGQFWLAVKEVLAKTAQVLPCHPQVVVVGDRGFGSPAFTDLVSSVGWQWLVRLQGQTYFKPQLGPAKPVSQWLARAGQRRKGWGQLFKKQGWRSGSLVGVWNEGHKEGLLLGSSLSADYALVRLYKYRYAIEAMFRDLKSYGLQWEASQVRLPEHCEKVVLGLAWAILVGVVLGEAVAEEELAQRPSGRRRTRPASARFSLVCLGLERVQSYLVGKVQGPVEWELSHYEAERWSSQIHQHHALAYLTGASPGPAKACA